MDSIKKKISDRIYQRKKPVRQTLSGLFNLGLRLKRRRRPKKTAGQIEEDNECRRNEFCLLKKDRAQRNHPS